MPSVCDLEGRRWCLVRRRAACIGLSVAALGLFGCDQQPADEARGGGYTEPVTENQGADGLPQPEAKSVLGKAKQSAERLVNEDVAEYNKKIEQAAEGKFP